MNKSFEPLAAKKGEAIINKIVVVLQCYCSLNAVYDRVGEAFVKKGLFEKEKFIPNEVFVG